MQMISDPRLPRCNSRLTLKDLLNFRNCTFPLVDKHSPNGQMVFLFGSSIGCYWQFWWHCFCLPSFLPVLFCDETWFPHWIMSQCHLDIRCQMSDVRLMGPLSSVVVPPMFVWHCVSVGNPAPYLSLSHPPVSDSGVMPSNIVPTAITSELELP